ncbi:MAG: GlsB/YeaQ/YmgE family stress response membrane protein [Gemmatimonadetes bacterium]|nr:GlsB/YeaQ/YmgE family stress response membrane protein [Gemmatimonadota bacterium]
MGILWTILIGFLIGLVARAIMPGKQEAGFIKTTLLGIGGSFVGSFLVRGIGWGQGVGFIGSVVGAIIILAVVGMMNKD